MCTKPTNQGSQPLFFTSKQDFCTKSSRQRSDTPKYPAILVHIGWWLYGTNMGLGLPSIRKINNFSNFSKVSSTYSIFFEVYELNLPRTASSEAKVKRPSKHLCVLWKYEVPFGIELPSLSSRVTNRSSKSGQIFARSGTKKNYHMRIFV